MNYNEALQEVANSLEAGELVQMGKDDNGYYVQPVQLDELDALVFLIGHQDPKNDN